MKMDEKKFSVLMSVYYKENPIYFRQSVESVIHQTIKPTEIVIVKDGTLTDELELTCSQLLQDYSHYIRFVPLEENVGLGLALQKGVLECRYDLIARMDTDDIAKPNRFEKQLKAFDDTPNLSICGGSIEEFSDLPQQIESVRSVPLENTAIYRYAKKRNPFNHMTVMFRKKDVLEAGNYQSFHLLEDYYLWFRMIKLNKTMKNLSDALVNVRSGSNMVLRRGGWNYFVNEKKLYDKFLDADFINCLEYVYVLSGRFLCRILPNWMRKHIYDIFFRSHYKNA